MGADLSNAMVVSIGVGTVFVGLVCLVLICYIMSAICRSLVKETPKSVEPVSSNQTNTPIANKQEVLAAVCAVIAEENGTEANNIKVLSFKKI